MGHVTKQKIAFPKDNGFKKCKEKNGGIRISDSKEEYFKVGRQKFFWVTQSNYYASSHWTSIKFARLGDCNKREKKI